MKKIFSKKWTKRIILIVSMLIIIIGARTIPVTQDPTTNIQQSEMVKDTYTVGDNVKINKGNVKISDVNVIEGEQFSKPDEGNVFVEVMFLYENTTENEICISSVQNFHAYVDGNSIYEDSSARIAANNKSVDGFVGPGETLEGNLCYQVPANWSELEIKFGTDGWQSEEVVFVINSQ